MAKILVPLCGAMMLLSCALLVVLLLLLQQMMVAHRADQLDTNETIIAEEQRVTEWLAWHNRVYRRFRANGSLAHWAYQTNLTSANAQAVSAANAGRKSFVSRAAQNASSFNLNLIANETLKRQLKVVSTVSGKLDDNNTVLASQLITQMQRIYATATICGWQADSEPNCSIRWPLDPDLMTILAESRDYDLLAHIWSGWRNATGRNIRLLFNQFVQLSNKGAKAAGYNHSADLWQFHFESQTFQQDLDDLWNELLPLYEQLHAYVRYHLKRFYKGKFNRTAIPAHILGDMWGQRWTSVYNITMPYPEEALPDVTEILVTKGYDAVKMFRVAEDFFTSLGLRNMSDEFWNFSLMVKPTDRQVVCHPSAWDLSDTGRDDYRIRMCTKVTMEDLKTIHHELGHIHYYMQYAHLPISFRFGANPGFHEAIGDTVAMSVGLPAHLKLIGLLDNYSPNERVELNYLYRQALAKVAFLPMGYLIDRWKLEVFDGSTPFDRWNDQWVQLRYAHMGVVPPVARDQNDFDPGAKFHITDNSPYARYFVSYVIQFQFFEALCKAAGHTGPLHLCDIYGSKAAGDILAATMALGSSKPWPDAMELITGQRRMSADSMKKYFQPLYEWLSAENRRLRNCYGWGHQWPPELMVKLAQPRCNATQP